MAYLRYQNLLTVGTTNAYYSKVSTKLGQIQIHFVMVWGVEHQAVVRERYAFGSTSAAIVVDDATISMIALANTRVAAFFDCRRTCRGFL